MSISRRLFWLVTLVLFAEGCSSTKVLTPPRSGDDTRTPAGRESAAKVGDQVSITLTDDSKIEGRIIAISFEAITLDGIVTTDFTKYPENLSGDYLPRVIAVDRIQAIEKQVGSFGKSFLLVVGLLAVAFGVVLALNPISVDFSPMGSGGFNGY